jgi:SAM-dependent methyltransferase
MRLSPSEVWHLSAYALHTPEYVNAYTDALGTSIGDTLFSVLDTACGSGFPLANLHERGFRSVQASDSDEYSVDRLKESLRASGIDCDVFLSSWQELADRVPGKFDVLINADNSFVYMDGWDPDSELARDHYRPGKEHAFKRAELVLSNFLSRLVPGGRAVVGLGKHYVQGNREWQMDLRPVDLSVIGLPPQEVEQRWRGNMDWETRTHEWYTDVRGEGVEVTVLRKSYLFTKEEIADLMRVVGFSQVAIMEPENTRDNLIIGTAPSA